VEESITIEGELFIAVTLAPEMASGVGLKGANVTGDVTISTGVPPIVEMTPGRPGGAADSGIVVGETMTPTPEGCPPGTGVFAGGFGTAMGAWPGGGVPTMTTTGSVMSFPTSPVT
jgi:hypothetical protein